MTLPVASGAGEGGPRHSGGAGDGGYEDREASGGRSDGVGMFEAVQYVEEGAEAAARIVAEQRRAGLQWLEWRRTQEPPPVAPQLLIQTGGGGGGGGKVRRLNPAEP